LAGCSTVGPGEEPGGIIGIDCGLSAGGSVSFPVGMEGCYHAARRARGEL
jgi:hypothetical protein